MVDYIEREKAIQALDYEMCGTGYQSMAVRAIKYMDSADVAPVVHAKWKDIEQGEASNLCECSNCKEWVHLYHDFIPNYCPCCGAKMDL